MSSREENWILREREFSSKNNTTTEGLFTQGSGYMHIRASLEEHLEDALQNEDFMRMPANVSAEKFRVQKAKWGTYVPGIYGKHPLLNNEIINLPNFLSIIPVVDGERLDLEKSQILNYERSLNLKTGLLKRELLWKTKRTKSIQIVFERFVSAFRPHICVQRMTLETENSAEVEVKAGIDADVRTNGYKHFAEISPFKNSSNEFGIEVLSDAGDKISIQTRLSGSIKDWICETSAETVFSKGRIKIDAGKKLVVEKRSFVKTSRDLVSSSDNDLRDIEKLSFEELLGENNKVWEKRWEDSDVVLDGNDYAQRALRVSLYHLLRAHVPNDSRVAIDAKGYAGEAYWGRFFWDTEMYLLPFFTATAPEKARTLVDFRVQSLEGAKQNAKRYGYSGARYAWESDSQGIDCCPNWQYGDHEIHITADVVYGLSYFAHATGDLDYLKDKASEVILETAKYWMERIDINTKTTQPMLLGVMGPDEYKAISNNNFYTNLMVKFALRTAASIAKEKKKVPESEWRAYEKAAETLPLLKREDGLYLQCEGFDDLAEPQFEVLWKDHSKPFAAQVSQERLYRSKCLKQADVLMAMYLFPSCFSNEDLQKAWDYYLPYTTHDSSLSTAIHAILACRLGKMDESWEFWMTSCGIDLDGGAAEGIHIAGAGGNWLVVVFGYAGLLSPLESETLTFNPRIPKQLQSIEFPLCWRNAKVRVKMSKNTVRIENKGETNIDITVWTKTKSIKSAEAISWEL